MLSSKVFGSCTSNIRIVIDDVIEHICINEMEFQNNKTSFETYIGGGIVPLDKNPALQPIGVGEVHHRIARKVFMSIVNNDVTKAVQNLELCGGQYAGCEAAVDFMHDIFSTNETEAVLLIDTENAFNSINRQVFFA